MSQLTVTTNTTLYVTVVCSGVSFITMTVIEMASTIVGWTTSGQHDAVLPPEFYSERDIEGLCWPNHYAGTAQSQSQMPFEGYVIYAMDPPQVIFLFQGLACHRFLCHVLVSVMVFAFCFQAPMWLPCSPIGAQPLGFATPQPFRVYLRMNMYLPLMVSCPC